MSFSNQIVLEAVHLVEIIGPDNEHLVFLGVFFSQILPGALDESDDSCTGLLRVVTTHGDLWAVYFIVQCLANAIVLCIEMKLDNMFWIVLLLGLHQIIDELEFSKINNLFWQNLNVSELVYLEYLEALYIVSVLCLLDLGLGIYLKQLLNVLASLNFFDNENPLMLHYM